MTRRPWLRTGLMAALGVLGTLAVVRLGGGAARAASGLQGADAEVVVLAAVLCALTYVSAALALRGATSLPVPLGPLVAVQVACAFTNRLLPGGVGTVATNGRFLHRAGLSRSGAAAAVSLNGMTGFTIHVVATAVALPLLLTYPNRPVTYALPSISSGQVLLGVGCAALVGAVVLVATRSWPRLAHLRAQVAAQVTQTAREAAAVLRNPRKASELLLGSFGVTLLHASAFTACVLAVGGTLPLLDVVAVYLVGAAVAAAAPTPGGLGAVEASLVFGLVTLGMPAPLAVAAVLWFRLLSFWAPTLPGLAAFGLLVRARRL